LTAAMAAEQVGAEELDAGEADADAVLVGAVDGVVLADAGEELAPASAEYSPVHCMAGQAGVEDAAVCVRDVLHRGAAREIVGIIYA